METTSAERVIWMVDDDEGFRELSSEAALDAGIKVVSMTSDELTESRGAALPDGAMLDGTMLVGPQADEILRGIPRIVICTGRDYKEIAERWTVHPHVRVLLKPMELDAFQDAIRWLAGANDSSSWPTQKPDRRASPARESRL
jgi:CheY-like chemotaxis protein